MDCDTGLGAGHSRFPDTRVSQVEAAASNQDDARRLALAGLIDSYWRPVYKYIRIRHQRSNEDAKDLTQGFFAVAMEKDYFGQYDPRRAAFRTFLRTCIDHFVLNAHRWELNRSVAGKVDLDDAASELSQLQSPASLQPDELLQREWQREVFTRAVNQLREECAAAGRMAQFNVFDRYVLDGDCSYADIAREMQIAETTVTNYLSAMRREFRRLAGQFTGD
jgi:RNA polymerase sigma factor (sigma-70 family)